MVLLLVLLSEWRVSQSTVARESRDKPRENRMTHLLVLEDAQIILRRPEPADRGTDRPRAVAVRMCHDLLVGARRYGQGILVIDPEPSLLIPGVIKNSHFQIVHQLPHDEDRAAMAKCLSLRGDQRDFLGGLAVGDAVISTERDDAPCWVSITQGNPEAM